jgi:hypothetical protein
MSSMKLLVLEVKLAWPTIVHVPTAIQPWLLAVVPHFARLTRALTAPNAMIIFAWKVMLDLASNCARPVRAAYRPIYTLL